MLEQPSSVRIALRILWSCLLLRTAILIAMFAFKWDVIQARLMEKSEQIAAISEQTLAMMAMIVAVAVLVTIFLLSAWILHKIGKGRNWARILLLIVFVLNYAYWISHVAYQFYIQMGLSHEQFTREYAHPLIASGLFPWTGILLATGVVCFIGGLIALILLFRRGANAWFQSNKRINQPSS